MNLLERLRNLAELSPPNGAIVLPVAFLRVELGLDPPAGADSSVESVDYTAAEVAALLGRAPVTVKAWCQHGKVPGSYKFMQREWRIPHSAFQELQRSQREKSNDEMSGTKAGRTKKGRDVADILEVGANI